MSGLCHIRRVRLINFHNLVDETLPVRRNLFLIGDNQSGKTTALDAVHFALTAGVEMELNAAARFGPRTEPGRNLASIVLRYDLERDIALRGPAVMYAALEIADASGTVHCFGAGAFATSLESQPDVWGFVARGATLEEIGLCEEEADGAGGVRRRPRDRRELEERLGRGVVFDKGRYRTALAQLLFRDRDAYERVLGLLAAGKAYREMVARARNLDELFIGLLPPPAEAEFEEVRSALRAIEGIRSDLGDLGAELEVLHDVLEKLQAASAATEQMARYAFVGAELARRAAARALEEARRQEEQAAADAARAAAERREAELEVTRLGDALRGLQASAGAALLAREEEARRDAADAEREAGRAAADLAARRDQQRRAADDAAGAAAAVEAAREKALAALRSASAAAREHLDEEAIVALGALAGAVSAFPPATPAVPAAAAGPAAPEAQPVPGAPAAVDRLLAIVRRGFEAASEMAAGRAAVAAEEAGRQGGAAAAAAREAEEVRQRQEMTLDLPGYGALLAALAGVAPQAAPLYRLFELASATPESLGAGIECILGPRVLGAVVVPPHQHAAARACVLAHGGGVEVVDPAAVLPGTAASARDGAPADGTLPAAVADAGPPELASIGRSFLRRVAGDVRILAAGEARGDAERAVWADGALHEQGAESRLEPAVPRWLGAAARARAAAVEAARLGALAVQRAAESRRAAAGAAAHREAANSCRQALERLDAGSPARLGTLAAAAGEARARWRERDAAAAQAGERVESAERRWAQLRGRLAEIAAAVASAGAADLRERVGRAEVALELARQREKATIAAAAGASEAAQRRSGEATAAAGGLQAATAAARNRGEALLPLLEDARHRGDLVDYAFRIMRGQQILAENVAGLIGEASNARARAFQWLDSSDGLRHERLWQKYAFRLDEARCEVRDQAGRPVDQVFRERNEEVQSLQGALDQRTRDLLERVVMAGLVRRLQGQVRELRDVIQGINRLAADLRFGASRFQFSLRQRPERQRLLELLREQSALQPALREELRDFFAARLDDLRQVREGEVPEILDYRRWFEYVLQVQSRSDGGARDLSRQRLRFGSTGEQAVPTYLLVIAVASLLYDRTDARLRLLLLDEAFLGIDAGRREVLMQFADRAGVDLIVATPELDGVTPALAASSTLFIEKTAEQDVFISDFHWARPDAQAALFERPAEPAAAELLLGVAREAPAAAPQDGADGTPPQNGADRTPPENGADGTPPPPREPP